MKKIRRSPTSYKGLRLWIMGFFVLVVIVIATLHLYSTSHQSPPIIFSCDKKLIGQCAQHVGANDNYQAFVTEDGSVLVTDWEYKIVFELDKVTNDASQADFTSGALIVNGKLMWIAPAY